MGTPDIKLTRMNLSESDGTLSIMDLYHLVGTTDGVHHFVNRLEMGLFMHEDYLAAFAQASLKGAFDDYGLIGRGLNIGVKKVNL